MKYINVTNNILIADTYTIYPKQVIELSDTEIKKNTELKSFIQKGYLKSYTSKIKISQQTVKDNRKMDEKNDNNTSVITKDGVAFVVNKSVNPDIAEPASNKEIYPDIIDVSNNVDKIEEMLNEEGSDFNPDSILADNEEQAKDIDDATEFLENEYSTIIKNAKKEGAKVMTAKNIAKENLSKTREIIEEVVSSAADEGENANTNDLRVKEFLSKPFFTKKKEISTSTDVDFLQKVLETTASKNVQKLVQQRLFELNKK